MVLGSECRGRAHDYIDASIRFYTEKVGLTLDFRYSDFYAGIRAGNNIFHLKLVDDADPSIAYVRDGGHLELYLGTPCGWRRPHAGSNGVALLQEPTDTSWNTRELVLHDDQGHTIYVGQPMIRSKI